MPIAVFDFDRTLTTDEIHTVHGTSSNLKDKAFGGAHRVEALQNLFQDLKGGGVVLSIVSYNSKKVIIKALDAVGLAHHIDAAMVFGRETWESQVNSGYWSKARVLQHHIAEPAGAAAHDILFIDDDPGHCREVASVLPQACVILVPRTSKLSRLKTQTNGGMQEAHITAVRAWADERSACRACAPLSEAKRSM